MTLSESSISNSHKTEGHRQKTAILFLDFQNFILQNFLSAPHAASVVEKARTVLEAARKAGYLVVHVNVCFRPGYPEISPRNRLFSSLRDHNIGVTGSEATDIHPALTPLPEEIVLYKRRVCAFGGTELETILRAQSVERLVLAGVTTANVVLSTLCQALDLDYEMMVITDACADRDENTHHFLTQTLFPRLASVKTSEEFVHDL